MLRNYIKIAVRTLFRRSLYTAINVIGLSTGLLCVIFILNWVQNEVSYDTHFKNGNDIYRVVAEAGTGEDRWHQTVTSLPLGPTMRDNYPEVVAQTRLDKNNALVSRGEIKYVEKYIILTDPSFFEVFDYHLKLGNEKTALSNPYQIVLTESIAKKYFGDENPLGKSLKIYQYEPDGNGVEYEVTGVIADPPVTSHFTFNILASISTIEKVSPESMTSWGNNSYHTYVLLKPNSYPKVLEAKLPEMVATHMGEMIEEYDLYYRFYLQPIRDIHLYSDLQYEFMANGNVDLIWIFSSIGILILLLAGINYVNLSTSFSLDRAKEVGVRKVMGANKMQLIKQHLTETVIIILVSILLCGLMIELFKPLFYDLTGKYDIIFDRKTILIQLIVLCIPLIIIAGYFPARLLANVNTVSSLKGKVNSSSKNNLRSVLVAFQFAVSIFIISSLVVIQQQLTFVQSKDLGYDKENLLILKVNGSEEVKNKYSSFMNALISSSNVKSVARSSSMIVGGLGNSNASVIKKDGQKQFEKVYRLPVDYDYLRTYDIPLVSGRNFSRDIASDSSMGFVVNEKFVEVFGWTIEGALNQEMSFNGRKGTVIGVVKDFHFNSLHNEIGPICLFIPNYDFSRISIKGYDSKQLLTATESIWHQYFPNSLFDYTFQDAALHNTYESDLRFNKIFNVFAILSTLIAFLGLFGLIGYIVKRRTKEIGIRKVLGSSSWQIISLIAIQFLKLAFIASLLAIPFAWWSMKKWLGDFIYRIDLQLWQFGIALFVIIFFACTVVILQTLKPSLENPVITLKDE